MPVICPKCGRRLGKEDIQKFIELDLSKGLEYRPTRKYLMCKVCGNILAEKELT